ncbi:hypothetical protein DF185_11965 [Marinifilum breve]|uniref:Lipid A biosynthesis acyltransferase n=1 Tax=Marinifilum breve TaxID=2184082 RepID=A0A2V3ZVY0_9BACT|nr:hypothetical protein [Marinifilum breve]PXY00622.1 hypothetical protein DF185_11965 [Marinifilum breve]
MNVKYKQAVDEIKENTKNLSQIDARGRLKFLNCISARRVFLKDNFDGLEFYRNIIQAREFSIIDEEDKLNSSSFKVIGAKAEYLNQVNIYALFHLGSYRLPNHYFSSQGMNFSILLNDSAYQLRDKYKDLFQIHKTEENQKLNFINAEIPSSLLQIIRSLRSGYSLSVYIDGNEGVVNSENQEKFAAVNFFGEKILTRKGIANVAYRTGTPIIPVITFKENDTNIIEFLEPIEADKSIKQAESTLKLIQTLWNVLEMYVKKYPNQWQGWIWIHKFINRKGVSCIQKGKLNGQFIFNAERYSFLKKNQTVFLFDHETFINFKINNSLFTILDYLRFNKLEYERLREIISENLLNDLYTNKIILNS